MKVGSVSNSNLIVPHAHRAVCFFAISMLLVWMKRHLSAPGMSRTPDLQVRSLTAVRTQPTPHHLSPVGTRADRQPPWCEMGSDRLGMGTVRAHLRIPLADTISPASKAGARALRTLLSGRHAEALVHQRQAEDPVQQAVERRALGRRLARKVAEETTHSGGVE